MFPLYSCCGKVVLYLQLRACGAPSMWGDVFDDARDRCSRGRELTLAQAASVVDSLTRCPSFVGTAGSAALRAPLAGIPRSSGCRSRGRMAPADACSAQCGAASLHNLPLTRAAEEARLAPSHSLLPALAGGSWTAACCHRTTVCLSGRSPRSQFIATVMLTPCRQLRAYEIAADTTTAPFQSSTHIESELRAGCIRCTCWAD